MRRVLHAQARTSPTSPRSACTPLASSSRSRPTRPRCAQGPARPCLASRSWRAASATAAYAWCLRVLGGLPLHRCAPAQLRRALGKCRQYELLLTAIPAWLAPTWFRRPAAGPLTPPPPLTPQRPTPLPHTHPSTQSTLQELDPYKTSEDGPSPWEDAEGVLPTLNADEVTQLADYKNAPMLSTFLSGAGPPTAAPRVHDRTALRLLLTLGRSCCRTHAAGCPSRGCSASRGRGLPTLENVSSPSPTPCPGCRACCRGRQTPAAETHPPARQAASPPGAPGKRSRCPRGPGSATGPNGYS